MNLKKFLPATIMSIALVSALPCASNAWTIEGYQKLVEVTNAKMEVNGNGSKATKFRDQIENLYCLTKMDKKYWGDADKQTQIMCKYLNCNAEDLDKYLNRENRLEDFISMTDRALSCSLNQGAIKSEIGVNCHNKFGSKSQHIDFLSAMVANGEIETIYID